MKSLIKRLLREGIVKNLQDDTFVHFTTLENAHRIATAKMLGHEGFTTFAVSVTWGIYNGGAVLPKNGGAAILFKTNKLPKYGYVEEVTWAGVVPLTYAKIISVAEAVDMLNKSEVNTPVGEMDMVKYTN